MTKLDKLTREDVQGLSQTITYTYDVGGNITRKTYYPYTTGNLGNPTGTDMYSYDSTWKDKLINGTEYYYIRNGQDDIQHTNN